MKTESSKKILEKQPLFLKTIETIVKIATNSFSVTLSISGFELIEKPISTTTN